MPDPDDSQDTPSTDPTALLAAARDATENAIAPYSGYEVGAAVATPRGAYQGCNLEVSNYSNSLHAEAVALAAALSDGATTVRALAVTTSERDGATPCGTCRQTLWEFCDPGLAIYCDTGEGYDEYTLGDLLPAAFDGEISGMD